MDDNNLPDSRITAWGNGSFCPTLRRRESAEEKALPRGNLRAKGGQRKVMQYARRIAQLSSEGVGGDLEQQTDTTASERDT